MRRAAVIACLLACAGTAWAHRIDEFLQATVLSLGADRVEASMRLIPGVLVAPAVIAEVDRNGDGAFSDDEERAYAQRVLDDLTIRVDGRIARPQLVSWSFPAPAEMRAGLGEIRLAYTVGLAATVGLVAGGRERSIVVENHHDRGRSVYLMNAVVPEDRGIRIVGQKRNAAQSTYELDYERAGGGGGRWADAKVWLQSVQFSSLFRLGMRHIAEGTDHLLFLLTLLLPAPLIAVSGRWTSTRNARRSVLRILRIVTAFTIGHSITLALAAMGLVRVPGAPVEVLIAVSIFVSAVHALRPIVPGREAWIAGFFGLIHGLAFAATLDRLGMGRWERVAGIVAFNLGVETTQMIVVAVVLPSLILMSRTRAYPVFRVGGAVFAGVASLGWMVERMFGVELPVDRVMDEVARHALGLACGLLVVSVVCWVALPARGDEGMEAGPVAG